MGSRWEHHESDHGALDPPPSFASILENGSVAGLPNASWLTIYNPLGGVGKGFSSIDPVGPTRSDAAGSTWSDDPGVPVPRRDRRSLRDGRIAQLWFIQIIVGYSFSSGYPILHGISYRYNPE